MSDAPPKTATFFPTILFLGTIGFFATDLYLPSFPSIQTALHTLKIWVQLSLTFFTLGLAVSQILYGPLSDRIGKKTAQIGLVVSLLGTLLCLFAPNVFSLIVGRTLQGMGLGAGATLFRAILRDSYSGDDLVRFGSLVAIGSAAFMALGPTIGGYVQHFLGWRINFLLIFLYTILGILSVHFWLPETNRVLNPMAMKMKVFLQNYYHLLRARFSLATAYVQA